MRISDWSSDVCSSDLPVCLRCALPRTRCATLLATPNGTAVANPGPDIPSVPRDRKSVVWGKSVSVRVDLGGRRIIKKKNKCSSIKTINNQHKQQRQHTALKPQRLY